MTEATLITQFNRSIVRREGPAGISNTEAIRIIPRTWSETNVFLIHRTTRKQVLRPPVDQIYLVVPLVDRTCFLHLVDQSEPSWFTRDNVACVGVRNLPKHNHRIEITTRHLRRGAIKKKVIVV